MTDLTKGGELKALFVFALPIFLGNLFEQLYNITDTVIVGNLLGAEALAAVGSSTQILALTISVSTGMSIGASVIISQLYGAKRNQNMKEVVDTNIIFISLFSFFLMVLGLLYSPVLLEHLNVPASLLSDADAYLQTILLDVIFIKFFTYGVVGAALATVLAQVFSFIVCLRYMYRYYPKLAPNLLHLKWKVSVLKTSLAIGLPAMLQQIFISLGFLVIQFLVNGFGANAIAAYTAASKVDAFAEMPAINLGQALMNFTAQNKGAGEQKRIAKGGRSALIITLGISIAISGLIYSFAPHFIAIFNRQKAIVQIGEGYLRIVSIFYFVFGAMQVLNGLLLGYGKSLLPLIASVTTFCLLQVPLAVCLSHTKLGFNGIWLAAPFGWFAGFLMRLIYFTNISKHIERKE
ncbi:MATE family efflux transporter [Streptococcus sanguinis]|jgi:MATE efflux family protein|uniref:Probable multidrug resistance protein NorM n=3 Tax=Streptococcus TaxID=1301 RepID=F3USQ8_STRSA|nr:MATE efflux family protein [Streptococcus sanguinis SK355]EGJ44474.1 MATE efflux family protein [Streptococcus sanguinis SK1059]EGQ21202.1 MATE efflux family protein [Streptococcus sanguinis ATCC 29667]EGQ24379.1 MATE efflux family protein [Streptococcus sanguinis SK340]MCY7024297.1 MATE family efflux transporter [Streptococcus sanguinis]